MAVTTGNRHNHFLVHPWALLSRPSTPLAPLIHHSFLFPFLYFILTSPVLMSTPFLPCKAKLKCTVTVIGPVQGPLMHSQSLILVHQLGNPQARLPPVLHKVNSYAWMEETAMFIGLTSNLYPCPSFLPHLDLALWQLNSASQFSTSRKQSTVSHTFSINTICISSNTKFISYTKGELF